MKLKISATDKIALANVKLLLEKNPVEFPGLKFLSRYAGLNECKLKNGFNILYGCPPYQYHIQLCLQEAKRLLQQTDDSISSIAYRVGFEHVSSFCSAFKRSTGCRPLEYRREAGVVSRER